MTNKTKYKNDSIEPNLRKKVVNRNEETKEQSTKQTDSLSPDIIQKSPIAPPLPEFLKKTSLNSYKNNITSLFKNIERKVETNFKQETNDTLNEVKKNFISPDDDNNKGEDVLFMHKQYFQHHLGKYQNL